MVSGSPDYPNEVVLGGVLNTQEAGVGGSQIQGQPGLCKENLSKKKGPNSLICFSQICYIWVGGLISETISFPLALLSLMRHAFM